MIASSHERERRLDPPQDVHDAAPVLIDYIPAPFGIVGEDVMLYDMNVHRYYD